MGLGYFVGSLQWLTTVTVAGWLALAAYLAVYPALWALFVGLMARVNVENFGPEGSAWRKSLRNFGTAALAAAAREPDQAAAAEPAEHQGGQQGGALRRGYAADIQVHGDRLGVERAEHGAEHGEPDHQQ